VASPLHPDCVTLLEMARRAGRPGIESVEPPAARAQYLAGKAALQAEAPPIGPVRNIAGPGFRMRLYRPQGARGALPCLVFAHGGGWVIGDLDSHDNLARTLCHQTRCAVLAVDYRLAPEHPFPAAVQDMAAAVRFAHENAKALRIDARRLAVGGDSAGGNLAAVAALMARDGALPALCHQSLLYPCTEMAATHPSCTRFTEGLPLIASTMHWFRNHYAPAPAMWEDWRASPLRAASLAGTAPAFVLTVGHDPLCDEGIAYAQRLEREGVRVTHLHAADLLHGALTMTAVIRPVLDVIAMASAALARDLHA